MAEAQNIRSIRIGLASPQQILSWSSGEVRKPETINYRTYKPERDGLFCERIFGPTKDWECHCGRYKRIKYKGIICDKCGVQVTRSQVRRRRMGHITLASPVVHIWYLKAVPSPVGLLLDMPPKALEEITYFASYVVTKLDRRRILTLHREFERTVEEQIEQVRQERDRRKELNRRDFEEQVAAAPDISEEARQALESQLEGKNEEEDAACAAREADLRQTPELLKSLQRKGLIKEVPYRNIMHLLERTGQRLEEDLSEVVQAAPGAEALKILLQEINLEELARELHQEIEQSKSSGAKLQRAVKRLSVANWFRVSRNRPEWMILDVLPVLPPDLRPMVQLDGGRFATSDVNDLYRRVINRNNRLKRITEIRAPESIINHERRLLQEAVDALVDNSRRRRPVTGPNKRQLKSLTDMLKGKEGRFRKNLLGKRVDYSGRSVIVIGPELKLYQCGLPREMALELFKPMVIRRLYEQDATRSIKKTKRMVERLDPEVWDALEEVVEGHPVLLNRPPTLHRLGIQAFIPKLIDGKAIQVHPLICHAFNADFDGDQMAVHVPLSVYAQAEALLLMLSTRNLFKPADGSPIVAPLYDIVLGCSYLTLHSLSEEEEPQYRFGTIQELLLAYQERNLDLHMPVAVRVWEADASLEEGELHVSGSLRVRDQAVALAEAGALTNPQEIVLDLAEIAAQAAASREAENAAPGGGGGVQPSGDGGNGRPEREQQAAEEEPAEDPLAPLRAVVAQAQAEGLCPVADRLQVSLRRRVEKTTIGRALFNSHLPACFRDYQAWVDKKSLAKLARDTHKHFGADRMVELLESVKELGFYYATIGGISLSLQDMEIPPERPAILDETQRQVDRVNGQWRRGLITSGEREQRVCDLWRQARDQVAQAILDHVNPFNPLDLMVSSGSRGSMWQVCQLAGMRGLMSDPFGRLIEDLPVKSNFREGLKVLEYFVSTHGTRKGLADTALRTADAGYLTRKLVDVAQEIIVREEDCGTSDGIIARPIFEDRLVCTVCGREDLHRRGNCFYCGEPLPPANDQVIEGLRERLVGRVAGERVVAPETGEVLVEPGVEMTEEMADRVVATDIREVKIRSALTCRTHRGLCRKCYGRDLASHKTVELGEAVGVIAAQSIGEPGTQITMRTFHVGGVASRYMTGVADVRKRRQENLRQLHEDIEKGLVGLGSTGGKEKTKAIQDVLKLLEDAVDGILRVQELLEARRPKGQAIVTEVDGVVDRIDTEILRRVVVASEQVAAQARGQQMVEAIVDPQKRKVLVEEGVVSLDRIATKHGGRLPYVTIHKAYLVPYRGYLEVERGMRVQAGDRLTQGPLDPDELLAMKGIRAVQEYLLQEVQLVYRSQAATDINDKHIETIISQMFRKRRVEEPGDTEFLPGQLVELSELEEENRRVTKARKQPATYSPVILGITEASLATESFLAAASFQKTTKVLTEAAIQGKEDPLFGLKENVIIGRLIPAGTGFVTHAHTKVLAPSEPEEEQLVGPLPELEEEEELIDEEGFLSGA